MIEAIGINIYGGGFTLAAQRVFKVLGQWEEITLGKDTFDLNFGSTIPRPLSIKDWPVKKFEGVPFVFANPPCAPWSSANTRPGYTIDKRFLDARLALTLHTMSAAMKLHPQVFISESVENAYNFGKEHYAQYVKRWMKLGYSVTFFLTDAIIHGLPSMRRRFHFIAHKVELNLEKPDMQGFEPTTVRDAIGDIQRKIGRMGNHDLQVEASARGGKITPLQIMQETPKGGWSKDIEVRHGSAYKGPHSSFLVKRLMWDAPSFTVLGFDNLIHPDGQRKITWREGMRLLSYPDTFNALYTKHVEITDTVTPLMGEYLSNIAKTAIDHGSKIKQPTHTVVDWRPLGKPYHINVLKHNPKLR